MRAVKLPKEIESFLDAAETVGDKTLVFTRKERPVAALVSLRQVDRESLSLSTNPQFLKIIEQSRKEVRAGNTISLEKLQKKYAGNTPNKGGGRTRKIDR